jgi:phosphoribosylformylglycinamidine synthase subunit PurS
MKFTAHINIMPHEGLLDPQGKTVLNNMKNLDIAGVQDVRIGRHVTMQLDAADAADASQKVESACKNLLANLIVEKYEFSLTAE